jgi:hypothetical protein
MIPPLCVISSFGVLSALLSYCPNGQIRDQHARSAICIITDFLRIVVEYGQIPRLPLGSHGQSGILDVMPSRYCHALDAGHAQP